MKLRLLGFARVSTDRQESNTSLDDQKRTIRQYCEMHGHELVDIVAVAESGYEDRPEFEEATARIYAGEADGLIVSKLDRFARSTRQGLNLFVEFEEKSKHLVIAKDQIDTSTPMGRAFFQMSLVMAELERNNIVDRVNRGLAAKKERDGYCGGRPPYGWDVVSKKLRVNMDEQAIIETMRYWRSKGITLGRIAERLNNEGIPSKTGGKWSAQTVQRVAEGEYLLSEFLPKFTPPPRREFLTSPHDQCNNCYYQWEKCRCYLTSRKPRYSHLTKKAIKVAEAQQ